MSLLYCFQVSAFAAGVDYFNDLVLGHAKDIKIKAILVSDIIFLVATQTTF